MLMTKATRDFLDSSHDGLNISKASSGSPRGLVGSLNGEWSRREPLGWNHQDSSRGPPEASVEHGGAKVAKPVFGERLSESE